MSSQLLIVTNTTLDKKNVMTLEAKYSKPLSSFEWKNTLDWSTETDTSLAIISSHKIQFTIRHGVQHQHG